MRWENPPEGAKNLQGYSIHTETHKPQQRFTRFLRIWSFCTKGRRGSLCSPEQRERRTEGVVCSPRREGEGHELAGAQSETVAAGGGRSPAGERESPGTESKGAGSEKLSLWLGCGLEAFF